MKQLIANKRGIESFPFFLFLSIFIAVFVIIIGFAQFQNFRDFSAKKDMAESYNSLINNMELLSSTADEGSFTRVNLNIPPRHEMIFSPENNTITIRMPETELVNQPDFEIFGISDKYRNIQKESFSLKSGFHEIIIYYGESSENVEPFQLFFR